MKIFLLLLKLMPAVLLGLSSNASAATDRAPLAKAIFAGGSFWFMAEAFDRQSGVIEVIAGYTGGHTSNPTYEEVAAGDTGHVQAVQVYYDPSKTGYGKLLDIFWHNVDPTVGDGQFCDAGSEYRSEIFYLDGEQQRLAEQSKAELIQTKPFKEPIATKITPASTFYPAEQDQQYYYRKNPIRYGYHYYICGRAERLEELWENEAD